MPSLQQALPAAGLGVSRRVHRTRQFRTVVRPLPRSGSGTVAGPTLTHGSYWKTQMLPC